MTTADDPALPPRPDLWREVPHGRVLVFAPHPDDEVAGPGGTLARHVAAGDPVRVVTRRGTYECRVTIGLQSELRPSRSEVPEGYLFSPWNLSVADTADPTRNRWLVNAVSHRAWDPVSGQADFKKIAARIERI